MPWPYIFYTNILVLIGVTMAVLACNLLWKRQAPESTPLGLLMLGTAIWSILYAMEIAAPDLQIKLLGAKLKYVGIVLLPTSGLLFALRYNRMERWLKLRYLILLAIGTVAPPHFHSDK